MQVSLPPTPAEALAHAQLLLDFPPTAGKLDEWRATIRSLVAVANKDEPCPVGPPGRRSDGVPRTSGGKAGGATTTVHSPLPHPVPRTLARRDVAGDAISIASSDLRPTVTSAKFFGNEPMKMLEPLSSAGAERATSQTGEQGLL